MKNYLETDHSITPFEKIDYIYKKDDGGVKIFNYSEQESDSHIGLFGKEAEQFLSDYREWRESLINKLYIPKEQTDVRNKS